MESQLQPATAAANELRDAARAASQRARVPYSNFRVGAALRFRDGGVVTGCNVENASYGLTVCAERTALVRAIAEGRDTADVDLVAVHVDGPSGEPCGMCRQTLLELVPGARIAFVHDGEYVEMPVRELLPAGFVPAALGVGVTDAVDAFFGSAAADDGVRRSGFVAVAGRPNAGKSTLVNRVVGHHVAIVSPIAQTTRRIVRAVARRDDAQLVFVDLPGSQKPMDQMTERMQRAVEQSFADVDAVLWVIDVLDEPGPGERHVASMVLESGKPVVLALNKVDRARPDLVARRIVAIQQLLDGREFAALVPISAATGDGVDRLLDELVRLLPEGPAWFGDDDVVDMRDEERIAEYVREATLRHLRDELPHASAVTVDDMLDDEDDPERLRVHCTIWVERQSQVGIVVGKGGEQVRDIGIAARRMVEQQLGRDVHLELRVKVRKHWRDDAAWLARAGL